MSVVKNWRVWIAQVNQTYVDVDANDRDEAEIKASRKWRREHASATILDTVRLSAPSPRNQNDQE